MKIVNILVLSFALTFAAVGQQQTGGKAKANNRQNRIVIVDAGISLGKPILLLPPSLRSEAITKDPFLRFLKGNPGVKLPFVGGMIEQKPDLLSPLRLQLEREAQLRPLQTILGTVGFAGAAFIAYEHVRKYGLW